MRKRMVLLGIQAQHIAPLCIWSHIFWALKPSSWPLHYSTKPYLFCIWQCALMCVHLFTLPFLYCIIFILQVVPVKATFVEYTVQQCPEGVTERGTCQQLTLNSDTEVHIQRHCPDLLLNTVLLFWGKMSIFKKLNFPGVMTKTASFPLCENPIL